MCKRTFCVKNGILEENGHAKGLLGQKWGFGENGHPKGLWVKIGASGEMAVQRDFWVKMGF